MCSQGKSGKVRESQGIKNYYEKKSGKVRENIFHIPTFSNELILFLQIFFEGQALLRPQCFIQLLSFPDKGEFVCIYASECCFLNVCLVKAGSIDAFICTPFSVGHDDNHIKCFVSFHGKHRMSKKEALK